MNRTTYVNNASRHLVSAILDHVTNVNLESHASMSDPNCGKNSAIMDKLAKCALGSQVVMNLSDIFQNFYRYIGFAILEFENLTPDLNSATPKTYQQPLSPIFVGI